MRRFVLILLLAWLLPVSVALFALERRNEESSVLWGRTADARYVRIGERRDDGAQQADLRLRWSGRRQIVRSGAPGVVTKVFTRPDKPLRDGQRLAAVDRRAVYVQVGGLPFYRDLGVGDRGPDVTRLGRMLSRALDRPVPIRNATFDSDVAAAVSDFYSRHGIKGQRVFTASDTVYAPRGAIVDVVGIRVGQRLSGSEQVADLQPRLLDVTVVLTGPPERQSLVQETPVIVGLPNGREIGFRDLQHWPDTLATLVQDSPEEIPGVIVTRATASVLGSVPSSAVVSSDRADCIYLSADDESDPQPVTLGESSNVPTLELGLTYVPADLVGESVLVNPASVDSLPPCG